MKKQSIWVFQWRKPVHYWWSYILFSPECKELTSMLDPLLYRWGVPPVVIRCVHWTMQMWVLQTWIKALGLYIVMFNTLREWNMTNIRQIAILGWEMIKIREFFYYPTSYIWGNVRHIHVWRSDVHSRRLINRNLMNWSRDGMCLKQIMQEISHGEITSHSVIWFKLVNPLRAKYVRGSLRNSTQHIGGHSVHQWAYLW